VTRELSVLQRVRVASPCLEPWAEMTGDERVRHCARCKLSVYNLSAMTRSEAEALVLGHEGRLCVGYYQRADGTILTRDCPVGLSLVRRKLARVLGGIAAAFAFIAGGLHALARGERGSQELRLRYFQPFDRMIAWLEPPKTWYEGRMALPPPTHADDLQSPELSSQRHAFFEQISSRQWAEKE
jgi:hypothetical protein